MDLAPHLARRALSFQLARHTQSPRLVPIACVISIAIACSVIVCSASAQSPLASNNRSHVRKTSKEVRPTKSSAPRGSRGSETKPSEDARPTAAKSDNGPALIRDLILQPVRWTKRFVRLLFYPSASNTQDLKDTVQSAIDLPFPREANETRRRIVQIGSPAAPLIAEAIRVSTMNPIKKAFLVELINEIKGEESTSALRLLLSNNEAHVRGRAAAALGKRRAMVAIPDLIALLNDQAVYVTTVITDPPSQKYVLVRDVAIESLENITGLTQAPHGSKEEQSQEWIRWWRAQPKGTAVIREQQN